ncbi:MAG: RNA methyltransferase [Cyclobacteriaceae bacterium]|nr:RNA methyltransferase [Cyclobacteriaceae bacterium]
MLSKARIKYIKSLQVKKYRQAEQRFVVEGGKNVVELLASDYRIDIILATARFHESNHQVLSRFSGEIIEVNDNILASVGEFMTNDSALAVVQMKPNNTLDVRLDEFVLMLDEIRDPGNLGTIIRIADWYGIEKIIASSGTTELYNPKVLHASMGSFTRVSVFYTELVSYLNQVKVPVLGTFLDGESIDTFSFDRGGIVIIGNESRGISEEVSKMVTKKITIPRIGKAESLNAAVATGIICHALRVRR